MFYTVSAVRLMRIEMGGAFADLLNDKGKGSGDNEMGYVERTLGFRTKDLDDRDLRLVLLFCALPFSLVFKAFTVLFGRILNLCMGSKHSIVYTFSCHYYD